jgi:hypothetical protein
MKIAIKSEKGVTTYTGIKNVELYPEGDSIGRCFVCMERVYSGSPDRFENIYQKPLAVIIEDNDGHFATDVWHLLT